MPTILDDWPDVPPPPTRLGCSVRVQRRVLRCAAMVRIAVASLEVVEEAILRRFADRAARLRERERRAEAPEVEAADRFPTLSEVFYGFSLEVQNLAAAMVDADERLERLRARRRACCDRRDDAARSLYREVSGFRRRGRRALGRQLARHTPALSGETLREPAQLLSQTEACLRWARSLDEAAPAPVKDAADTWKTEAAALETLRDALATTRGEAADAGDAVTAAVDVRDQAMAAFDRRFGIGSESLASAYVFLGLPTLAAAVRPHFQTTGRTGRPSKTPEPDEHPDLVARVLARAAAGAKAPGKRPFRGSA